MKKDIFSALNSVDPNGIAIEAMLQAEADFLENGYEEEEDEGFSAMAYKDDDGYWRITGWEKKWDDQESLMRDFPSLK
jgi:hypothetical protein